MKQLPSSEFRKVYARVNEPIEVTVFGEVIGTWFPAGVEITGAATAVESQPEAPSRMSIRPVHPRQRQLVARSKPVLDPLAMREQARTREDEVHPRQFIRNKRAD